MENILKEILKKTGIETSILTQEQEGKLKEQEGRFHENEIKKEILKYFHECVNKQITGKGKKIGELTEEGRDCLSKISGLDLKSIVDFRLNPSDMIHIYKEHYGDNEKDKGNNIALTDNDIMNMLDVISSPDEILYGYDNFVGHKTFFFFKINEKGTYNLAEIYTDKKGNLSAKSFYNTRKGIYCRVDELLKSSKLTTSEANRASLSYAKIPKLFKLTIPERQIIAPTIKNDFSNQPMFMMDKNGELYGYALGNRIVLTQKGLNPETMVHEYTHIWCTAMKHGNTAGWQSIKDLLKDTALWDDILKDPLYVDIRMNDDYVASEALARISGKENSSKMKELYDKEHIIKDGDSESIKQGMFSRLKKALEFLWSWVGKHMFDIDKFQSISEITDRVLFDLLKGCKLEINRPFIKVMKGDNPRITDISVYKNNNGDPCIRCKIDGVQQMGVRIKNKDLQYMDTEKNVNILAGKYFQRALDEELSRSKYFRR